MDTELMLDVGQAQELKLAFRKHGWTNAEIKRLSEGDLLAQVLMVMRGQAVITTVTANEKTEKEVETVTPLLDLVTTITIPAQTKPFIVRDHFKADTSEDAVVQIAYLGNNFKTWFLDKTEVSRSATTLCCRKLLRNSFDAPIIAELGGKEKAQTSLSELLELLKKQPRGQKGTLLTNGYANIFYILDNKGVLRAVRADRGDNGWYVDTRSVAYPRGWHDSGQVFSRNF